MAEQQRILRILEYVGDPAFIRDSIERRGVKGRYEIKGKGYIQEAILGETPEVLKAEPPPVDPSPATAAEVPDVVDFAALAADEAPNGNA